jgi:phospho-N-acetylmuramoyl-pentapeptide-transferase
MFYYLFDYLDKAYDIPGTGLFQYISFRATFAALTSLIISLFIGKRVINFLKKNQVGEEIRDLGLEGQNEKQGTPTMGGFIIIAAIVIPTLLFAKLHNIYIILMLLTTVWLGFVGFLDDYIKVYKKNKKGLQGKFKILGQVSLGIIIGLAIVFHEDVQVRLKDFSSKDNIEKVSELHGSEQVNINFHESSKSTKTTIPFLKNNEFDYVKLIDWIHPKAGKYVWIIVILAVIAIITAVSNSSNLTDGLDGLATGTSAIAGVSLGILAWVSGNFVFANYLDIMYIPNSGELVIFISAFVGACVGFMWFNTYPAQVFMGDTGSLALGGIIAVFAILIRKELLLPILCGAFFVESLSVIMQVSYFKYTKRKYGEGRRLILCSPLHHHFQKKGYKEPKIVMRFLIVSIALAMLTIITLKIR